MHGYIEFSGYRGYHVWLFLTEWIPVRFANMFTDRIEEQIVLEDDLTVECFPNKVRLKAGRFGQVLKIPCGIHVRSGRRSCFVGDDGEPVVDIDSFTETIAHYSLAVIPVFQVDNIAVIGNVQVTTQALYMLMQNGVDVSYFSRAGTYLGASTAESARNIFLRFEQYRSFMDEERRLEIARTIVDGKIRNQIDLIRRGKWTGIDHDWHADIDRMEQIRLTLSERKTTQELMGTEGVCSQIYFGAFGKMLKCSFRSDAHIFKGRNRRPPRDPVNIILSLAYTFLTREVCSILEAESFEPYLGFLHGIRYGRKSLALDLVEEFRQPAVDRFVLTMFNRQMISMYDFEDGEENRVVLNEDGYRKFCYEYERWMTGRNRVSGESSFRSSMRKQVTAFRRSIQKREPYSTYSMLSGSIEEVV